MLPYNKNLKELSKQLRGNMTEAERYLWAKIRMKQLKGCQFYRQKPIGDYIVEKGIAGSRQEAFDRYLEHCNVKKYPFTLEDAAKLMKAAGGILVLAHPNAPGSPSLNKFTSDLIKQTKIIEETMLDYLDGIECWHSRLNDESMRHYQDFVKEHGLIATGGSDCHQRPVLMGTLDIPDWVAEQEPFSF